MYKKRKIVIILIIVCTDRVMRHIKELFLRDNISIRQNMVDWEIITKDQTPSLHC